MINLTIAASIAISLIVLRFLYISAVRTLAMYNPKTALPQLQPFAGQEAGEFARKYHEKNALVQLSGRLVDYSLAIAGAFRWKLLLEVLLLLVWSSAVSYYFPIWASDDEGGAAFMAASSEVTSMMGVLLVFLTTFRSSHAYLRWWEGRIIWGKLLGATMNLTQQASLWMGDAKLAGRVARYCVAFAYCSKHMLREGGTKSKADQEELKNVRAARALACPHALLRVPLPSTGVQMCFLATRTRRPTARPNPCVRA